MDMYQKRKVRAEEKNGNKPKSSPSVGINWFPGHMAKTKRKISEQLKMVDAVAEIVDARIPVSSRNPDIAELIGDKPHIIILNKCDMADREETLKWIKLYKKSGIAAVAADCKNGKGINEFKACIYDLLAEKTEKNKEKGMAGKALRIMVVGIPNVGKSSFINKLTKGSKAKVENRPGVTRMNQWFKVDSGLELLDTPGVLWPKFEDNTVGEHLAITGAITDRITDTEYLAMKLLEILSKDYPALLENRYKLTDFNEDSYDMLCSVGKKRGMMIRGGEVDTERAANMLLEEYRNLKIGAVTLERINSDA